MPKPPGNGHFQERRFGNSFPPGTNAKLDQIKERMKFAYEAELLRYVVARGISVIEEE